MRPVNPRLPNETSYLLRQVVASRLGTQEIETSYYLLEKKSTEMPEVMANESGKEQTESVKAT